MGRRTEASRSRRWPRSPSPRRRHRPPASRSTRTGSRPTPETLGRWPRPATTSARPPTAARSRSTRRPDRRGRSAATGLARRWSGRRAKRRAVRGRASPDGRRRAVRRLDPLRRGRRRRQGAVRGAVRPARRRADRQEGLARARPTTAATSGRSRSPRTRRRRRTTRVPPSSTTRCSMPASGSPARPAGARSSTSSTTTAGPETPSTTTATRSGRGGRTGHGARGHRASCGSCASPTRTATSTRSRPATACGARTCATTTATASRQLGDGVDPNRNYGTNWGLDKEGASDNPASETYRGPGPDSEPRPRR